MEEEEYNEKKKMKKALLEKVDENFYKNINKKRSFLIFFPSFFPYIVFGSRKI